jgi:hypothetical protein
MNRDEFVTAVTGQSKCDRCGEYSDRIVDYFQLLCPACKNELFPNSQSTTEKEVILHDNKTTVSLRMD